MGVPSPPLLADVDMVPTVDPEISSPRDLAIFLLHVAAEVEHALLVQYLYASFTVPVGADPNWAKAIKTIAIQEMGHLITVQNVLIALRAPLNLEREDYPFRRGYYPFDFSLEPFSLKTLARYTLAEMPVNGHGLTEPELATLRTDAQVKPDGVTSVGLLYAQLIDTAGQVDAIEYLGDSAFEFQAGAKEWRTVESEASDITIVRRIKSRNDAVKALEAIAVQGEGDGLTAGSHFHQFLAIYGAFKAAPLPSADIASNPNTSGDQPAGEITEPRTRQWAHLFNLQYRLLLHGISMSLQVSTKNAARGVLVNAVAFGQMVHVGRVAKELIGLPLRSDGSATRAAPPFELPYMLNFSASELGNWLTLRDVLKSSDILATELLEAETDPDRKSALEKLRRNSAAEPWKAEPWKTVDDRIAELRPPVDIVELRLLPPMAIARFGSSEEPMDNYEVVTPPGTAARTLAPADTLFIDPLSGAVSRAATPATVRFRDAAGRIRPVSPFIEIWARFTPDGELKPLTLEHLESLELTAADVHWRVEVGNLKAARRTRVAEDRILATVDVTAHARTALAGICPNFKPGKSIPFGHVQYIQPTADFPEIRLRFTPSAGKVYGPVFGDPNLADDVYDSGRGSWDNFVEQPGFESTVPGGIYAGTFNAQADEFVSRGYLDDSCDGIVTVSILLKGGKSVSTFARIASGPPAFAPAAIPIRTVADEFEQVAEGPDAGAGTQEEVAAILRRALDTVRLMQTNVMNGNQGVGGVLRNTNNMPGHDNNQGRDRAFEPIFPPAAAEHALVVARHEGILSAVLSGAPVAVSPRLRTYERVGDLSDAGRQQMPAMMRGADGRHLALTRRQVSVVRRYEESIATPPPVPAETPREAMIKLIEHLRDTAGAAQFHGTVPGAAGGSLESLFADPAGLLDFLVTATSTGKLSLPAGRPMVVRGNPAGSAFVALISGNNFMATNFKVPIPALGNRTGIEIAVAWISSLT